MQTLVMKSRFHLIIFQIIYQFIPFFSRTAHKIILMRIVVGILRDIRNIYQAFFCQGYKLFMISIPDLKPSGLYTVKIF